MEPMLGLYDETENFKHVMKFIDDTVESASEKRIRLIITSPFIDEKTLKLLLSRVFDKPTDNLRVVLYIRFEAIRYLQNSNDHSAIKARQLCKTKHFEVKASGKPKYFHCKWLAAVGTESEKVDLLVTSANLTDSHLKEKRDGSYRNLDQTERRMIERQAFTERFLSEMDSVCEFIDL